jgi:hypothetical protein
MTKFVTGGVSQNRSGDYKVRYSTLSVEDTMVRQIKADNENNLYVDLPQPMTREELPVYLLTLKEFTSNPEYKQALQAVVAKREPKQPKTKVKAAKAPKTAVKVKIPSRPVAEQVDSKIAAMAA